MKIDEALLARVRERWSWWMPALVVIGLLYGCVMFAMFMVGALRNWPWSMVIMATNVIMLLATPFVAVGLWRNREVLFESLAGPPQGPSYTAAEGLENRMRWAEAAAEYRRVNQAHPLDAESLFRLAHIQRDRLEDQAGYEATLREIGDLPDDAEPSWIVREARDRLERMAAPAPEAPIRLTEIELPPEG